MNNLRDKVVTTPELVIMSWLCQGYERVMCDNNLSYSGVVTPNGRVTESTSRFLYGRLNIKNSEDILAGVTTDDHGSRIVVMNTDRQK